jgi:tyrosinase
MTLAPTPTVQIASTVQIDIPGALSDGRLFLGFAPVQATARLRTPPTAAAPVKITLRNGGAVGKLLFAATRTGNGAATLPLTLPTSGAPVAFWVGGDIAAPSRDYGDAAVNAMLAPANTVVAGTRQLMVRVRKNAATLTPTERDRFLAAMGTLNGNGLGRFRDFRDMHVNVASPEEHGDSGFLPWHRAYLLDLERELQAIDQRVALPYWRFDQSAAALFTKAYMGLTGSSGSVQFNPGHALEHWVTDGQLGISRRPLFNINSAPGVRNEAQTFALSGAAHTFASFRSMEGDPHGAAHTSFSGSISSIGTAAKDPLFFMLHCNVDRLWAKWQWLFDRHDPAVSQSYSQGSRVGHRLNDTMWPWNGIVTPPRPPTAPGGAFAGSGGTPLPGATPQVRAMLDYQGKLGGVALGFDYDDVPFEL